MVHMGFALRALSSISSLCNPLLRSHSWRTQSLMDSICPLLPGSWFRFV